MKINISIEQALTVAFVIIGGATAWAALESKQKFTEKSVEIILEDVEKHEVELRENYGVDKEQSVLITEAYKTLERINDKLDHGIMP